MKNNEIKKAIDKINVDDSTRIRILNNIKLNEKQISEKDGYLNIIKNKSFKYVSGAIVGALVLCGVFITTNNYNLDDIQPGETAGTSPQVQEKLAIVGVIEEISSREQGILIKVAGPKQDGSVYENISVYAHASTNIFEDNKDDLLEFSYLKVGQKVEVYYDGTEIENSNNEISGLKIIIMNN